MFLDPDRVRPLTYRVLLKQFQDALERPGVDYDGPPLGLHGIRVLGYNESKRTSQFSKDSHSNAPYFAEYSLYAATPYTSSLRTHTLPLRAYTVGRASRVIRKNICF